jgi:hypothetical protein
MFRPLAASLLILVSAGMAHAKPEIIDLHFSEGIFGPERKGATCLPLEQLIARFHFKGLQKDDKGLWKWTLGYSLRGPDGAIVAREQKDEEGMPDGESVGQNVKIQLQSVPGVYLLTVWLKDRLTSEETKIEREIKVTELQFAVVSPRVFDERREEETGISWHFVADQYCGVRALVVGYDWSQGEAHVSVVWRLLDGEGKLIRVLDDVQCDKLEYKEDNTRLLASEPPWVYFRAAFRVPQVKNLTLEVVATDVMAKKTATLRMPLKVHEP